MEKNTEVTIYETYGIARNFLKIQNIEISDKNILETMKIVSLGIINLSLNDIREKLEEIDQTLQNINETLKGRY